MFLIDKYRDTIDIRKLNGIYHFGNISATGKTRLAKLLNTYAVYGARTRSYTYSDYKLGIDIQTVLDPSRYDVIMLDRYDMYYGTSSERIREIADKCIILIDCKRPIDIFDSSFAAITMTECRIEVV